MNELRNNFDKAVKAYLDELHKMFGWNTLHGYWVADTLTMDEIKESADIAIDIEGHPKGCFSFL
jgi:hypothetical protein